MFVKTRLAVMMFLQYFVMGATLPILSLYLKDYLHFTGVQMGVVLGMSSIAAVTAPVIGFVVADRLLIAKHLLGFCHLSAAGLMLLFSRQSDFNHVVTTYLAYVLVLGPTVPLTNAITFHHLGRGNSTFGNTRVFGTIGWLAVAWLFGFLWLRGSGQGVISDRLPDALTLSGISSLLLSGYALTLPKRKTSLEFMKALVPADSLRVLFQPQVLLLVALAFIVGVVDRYYYFGAAPFLSHLGFKDAVIMPLMSIGQMVEIAAMALLAPLLRRVGIKGAMLLGIAAEIWRFLAFAIGSSTGLIVSGIACHGIAYALFFTTVYIAIDGHASDKTRTGLHQLFAIVSSGIGSLFAYLLAGACFEFFVQQSPVNQGYTGFWLVPTGLSLVALLLGKTAVRDASIPVANASSQARASKNVASRSA